jgi:hypothetical protein
MNEENGLRGGNKYEELVRSSYNENHIFALESDSVDLVQEDFL